VKQELKQALQKVGHPKRDSLHVFRHSYAAHLFKSGPDQRYILELLGHNSSKTIEIHTHVSTKNLQQIHLPFDDLQKIYTLDSGK
jgi:integrase/recombinase XerD